YREASRWVLVWRALSEADGEFTGMHSDETGWCIVHDSASGLDSPSEATTTLVQTCVRFVPMHFGGGRVDTEPKVDQFAQLLVEIGQADNREIAHMMERLMLDDALATDGLEIDEKGELTMKLGRSTLIQDLQKTLRERIRAVRRADGGAKRSDKREMSHSHLYATYFNELTSLYKRTDEIFQAVGIESTSGAVLGEMPTRKVDGDSEFFENVDVGRIPFSFQRTCDAVWELASAPHRQAERQVYSGLSDSENSIAVSYCIPCRRENGEVITLRTRLVSRRYVQKSRWVVVWRSLSVADGDFAGMNLDETVCVCVFTSHSYT
ncbi:hypothetical protein BBJ28_00014668, partial [Nothophytophthora sp. Chile5]